jgi:GNAT superfamily N-acetyltransferase
MGLVHPLAGPPRYNAPRPISPDDRLDGFECGKEALDDWLKLRALGNEGMGSRTYVVTAALGPTTGQVVAYYTLASGAVMRSESPGKLRRNMPDPVPLMVLGRLAVDRNHHGNRLAAAMMREAIRRVAQVSQEVGVRALIVHAIDDSAIPFNLKWDFKPFPAGSHTLFLPIETIRAAI